MQLSISCEANDGLGPSLTLWEPRQKNKVFPLKQTQSKTCSGDTRGVQKALILDLHYIKIDGFQLRWHASKWPTKWSPPKVTNFEIDVVPGSGTLMKPKYHYMVVGGLLVQELEPKKNLKAEKG